MLEPIGQRLRVTNVANGKSVVCTVADKGPNRRFWPRREVDLTPPASKAIGCDGMCNVSLERVAIKRPVDQKGSRPEQKEARR
jgi:rare lipoprotein A (peptidoglycan hydrolase)